MSSHTELNGNYEVIFSKAKKVNYRNHKQIQVSWILKDQKQVGLHKFIYCSPSSKYLKQLLGEELNHHLDSNEHDELVKFLNTNYSKQPFTLLSAFNLNTGFNDVKQISADCELPSFKDYLAEQKQ